MIILLCDYPKCEKSVENNLESEEFGLLSLTSYNLNLQINLCHNHLLLICKLIEKHIEIIKTET